MSALVVLSTLAACDPPPPVAVHSSRAYIEEALSLAPPPSDRARIFVFNGMRMDQGRWIMRYEPSDIYLNDVKIGSVDKMQVMAFDVAPGNYSLVWKSYGRSFTLLDKPKPSDHVLTAGTNLLLQTDLESFEYRMSPVHSTLYVTPARRISPDVEVIRPSACPQAICLP